MAQFVDLGALKETDASTKPANADEEWTLASRYYEDTARVDTQRRLSALGVGLSDNPRPLELSLLRRIIDRLAVVYDSPPTRWLASGGGRRLAETNQQHIAMTRVLDRAQYDLAWRRADKLRALLRQVVLRFYPSDSKGSVVVRIFEPFNVIRRVDPASPDQIEQDLEFALKLSSSGDDEMWEHWTQRDGLWKMSIVDQSGRVIPNQPFGELDGFSPYGQLPVQIVYDEYPGGRPWLPPRGSRTSFVESINAIANDLWSLIVHQAHTDRFFKTDDTSQVPATTGHGVAAVIPKDTDVLDMQPNPKITECQNVLETFIKLWSVSEDLPVDEFLNRQVVTGAALKASERALKARREAQALLAPDDERMAYRKLRAVHNVHTGSGPAWDLPVLTEDTQLDVVVSEISDPVDVRELQEGLARSMALGTKSVIDAIQAELGIARHLAVKVYERVKQDQESYPPSTSPAEIQSGPRLAGIESQESEFPDTAASNGRASVIDSIIAS